MKFAPENIYHIYNQGNNKEQLFFEDDNYVHFLSLYKSYVQPHSETLAWCLMPNHFHFMLYTDNRCTALITQGGLQIDPVTNGFRKLLSSYAHRVNTKTGRSGSLFRPKTKSKCLTDDNDAAKHGSYIETCFNYIHDNPIEAGLAESAEKWKWSSAFSYLNEIEDQFCNKEIAKNFLGW